MQYLLMVVLLPALIGWTAGWKLTSGWAVLAGGAIPALGWLADLVIHRPGNDSTLWWGVGFLFVALPAACIGAFTAYLEADHRRRAGPAAPPHPLPH